MFSQTVEYALRAMALLATNPSEPHSVDQIATATKVPPAYLSKVLQNLARKDLVSSRRGVQGGFLLCRPPDQITILDVVNAVEPINRIDTCPLELKSHGTRLCPLHRRLDSALAMVEQAFSATTLAAVVSEPGENLPLCDVAVRPISAKK